MNAKNINISKITAVLAVLAVLSITVLFGSGCRSAGVTDTGDTETARLGPSQRGPDPDVGYTLFDWVTSGETREATRAYYDLSGYSAEEIEWARKLRAIQKATGEDGDVDHGVYRESL